MKNNTLKTKRTEQEEGSYDPHLQVQVQVLHEPAHRVTLALRIARDVEIIAASRLDEFLTRYSRDARDLLPQTRRGESLDLLR